MKIKKSLERWAGLFFLLPALTALEAQTPPQPDQVAAVMRRVGDYQMAQPWPEALYKRNPLATGPKSWVAGSYYPGIIDLYEVTGDEKYLDFVVAAGEQNNWEAGPRLRAGDDQAIIQTYLDLYEIKKDPRMLTAAERMTTETMKDPRTGAQEWHWSDGLFMAPPIWSHYAAITGDPAYLDFMTKMYWEAVELLFSEEYRLFYRDARFKTMTSRYGKPVFWSRGNGWVAGSLVRILDYMPADYPQREKFEDFVRLFAARLKEIQQPDGFWKSSLLDPDEFPHGETSGTGLFCYMMAWGINHGVLDAETYLQPTVKAWNALCSAVHKDGKLGFAQYGGDRPYISPIDNTEEFAVGAFLMAGKEVLALSENYRQTRQTVSSSGADTWTATDGLGRALPGQDDAGEPRKDRFVGLFYFIWQGAHGYDHHRGGMPDGGICPKLPGDTVSPYNITEMLKANPDDPQYGPDHAFHYWSEPYFGYYLPDDEWVIRKHAQMLSDAGVDVIFFDVTNAAIYQPQVRMIADTYSKLRAQGISTPSIAFIVNSNPVGTATRLYEQFYKPGLYPTLWFHWQGKPLLLCNPEGLPPEIAGFFTLRQSWAWSDGRHPWFGDGRDKWPWLDSSPQGYGWHDDPSKAEAMAVCIAEHPTGNVGRSRHNGSQPAAGTYDSRQGLYFKEQWERALEVDPEFIFITGWNEWVAMRFTNGAARQMMGKPIEKGDTYFVDLYNAEFSRDAEPENGELADHYYWQMADGIRRFKGVRAVEPTGRTYAMNAGGDFSQWQQVEPVYRDDPGDTFHRKHPGWGRIAEYTNTTGRNDLVEARVADAGKQIIFYVKTAEEITPAGDGQWMNLWIGVDRSRVPHWETFHYLVNRTPSSEGTTTLERSTGSWNWEKTGEVSYSIQGNEMEIAVPKKLLNIGSGNYSLRFKWTDNVPLDGNPMHFLDKGDAAPNARFAYRFIYKK